MNGSLKKARSGEKEKEKASESRLVPLLERRARGSGEQTDGKARKAKPTPFVINLKERLGLRIL